MSEDDASRTRIERRDAERPIGLAGIVELARSGALREATHVVLTDQGITDEGLAVLFAALDVSKLEALVIAGCGIGTEGAERLARTPALAGLRTLDVAFDDLTASAVRTIVAAPHWTSLEDLNLSLSAVDASVARALAESVCLHGLRWLGLNDCAGLDDEFVEQLVLGGALPCLEGLSLGWNRITDRGARALARADHARSLRTLLLEGTQIGADGIALLRARGLDSLTVDTPGVEREPPSSDGRPF